LSDEDPTRSPNPTRYGAVWCDEHGKWECTRDKKQIRGGGRCHGPAITGLDVCRMHAGVRGDIAKAKGEAAITAWNALGKATVNPGEAVLAMLQMSWLRAHLYSTLLEYQVEEAQAGIEDERREEGAGPIGVGAGLVGHTYAAHPAIGVFRAGEAVRALVQLEAAERDRVRPLREGGARHGDRRPGDSSGRAAGRPHRRRYLPDSRRAGVDPAAAAAGA